MNKYRITAETTRFGKVLRTDVIEVELRHAPKVGDGWRALMEGGPVKRITKVEKIEDHE